MLEVGDNYLRVFKPDGTQVESSPGVPYEIATPYTEAYVAEIDYTQGEDTMYVFHSSVYPNRLRTFGDAKWDCSNAPIHDDPVLGEWRLLRRSADAVIANTVGTGRTMAAASAVFLASDVGRAILWNAGVAVITGFTDTQNVTVEVKVIFDSTAIPSGSWNLDASPQTTLTPGAKDPIGTSTSLTLAANGWRSTDVGKFVRINSGLIKVTGYTSGTVATGTIVKALTATTAAPALSWTLESSDWGGTNGYPRTGTMHQQRLVCGGTAGKPQTVFGSKTSEPLDFTKGTADDDSFIFTIGTSQNQVTPINYMLSTRDLLLLTHGGEYSLRSGVEKPITPTNVQIKPESSYGCAKVKPASLGKETLFSHRAGRKMRAAGFRYDEDGYKSPDLTTLAEHITETGIREMAVQLEPDPVVWVVLNNGRLISITLDRELDVIAWNRHEIDGGVESVATVPDGDKDQVWLTVRRMVDGAVVRYVERLQPDWYPIYGTASPDPDDFPPGDEPTNWGFQLDCAISQDDAVGKATWDVDHLEGRSVRCLADGVDMGSFTVAAGEITLPRAAKRTLIGLMVAPEIVMLTPEVQTGTGTSQADAMSVSGTAVRVHNTLALTVNGQQVIPGRIVGPDQLDMPPELFTGDKRVSTIGWDRAEVTLSQDAPFPFHVLAVIRTLTVNGG
jgi:hypothetical protein